MASHTSSARLSLASGSRAAALRLGAQKQRCGWATFWVSGLGRAGSQPSSRNSPAYSLGAQVALQRCPNPRTTASTLLQTSSRNSLAHKALNSTRTFYMLIKFVNLLTSHPQPLSHWERVAVGRVR